MTSERVREIAAVCPSSFGSEPVEHCFITVTVSSYGIVPYRMCSKCGIRETACPECDGAGWVVGVGIEFEDGCCGGSDWECGGRGCTGPVQRQVQVQIQELCEACEGTGQQVAALLNDTQED